MTQLHWFLVALAFAAVSLFGFFRYGKTTGWRFAFLVVGLGSIVAVGWVAKGYL